ncbi:MAG TPA: hypothetical protein V6C85_36555 [Allocoleopsis sp.]
MVAPPGVGAGTGALPLRKIDVSEIADQCSSFSDTSSSCSPDLGVAQE